MLPKLETCVFLLEDGAGEGGLVEAEGAPDLQQRGQDHAEGEDPDPEDHEQNVQPTVDVVVAAVVCDQNISSNQVMKRRNQIGQ